MCTWYSECFCEGDPCVRREGAWGNGGVPALTRISELVGNKRSPSPPAALPLGKEPPVPIEWRPGGSHCRSGRLRKETSLVPV